MKIYMKNGRVIKINRRNASGIWDKIAENKSHYINITEKETGEILLILNLDEISHIM